MIIESYRGKTMFIFYWSIFIKSALISVTSEVNGENVDLHQNNINFVPVVIKMLDLELLIAL